MELHTQRAEPPCRSADIGSEGQPSLSPNEYLPHLCRHTPSSPVVELTSGPKDNRASRNLAFIYVYVDVSPHQGPALRALSAAFLSWGVGVRPRQWKFTHNAPSLLVVVLTSGPRDNRASRQIELPLLNLVYIYI